MSMLPWEQLFSHVFLSCEGHTFRSFDSIFQSSRKYRWEYECCCSVYFRMILLCLTSKASFVSSVHLPSLCACVSLLREPPFPTWLWCSSLMGQVAWCAREAWPETKELEITQPNTFVIENSWQTENTPLKTEQALLLLQCKQKNREKEAQCGVSWWCSWAVVATAGAVPSRRTGVCVGAGQVNSSQPQVWAAHLHRGARLWRLVLQDLSGWLSGQILLAFVSFCLVQSEIIWVLWIF